jgi:hypothetical protein
LSSWNTIERQFGLTVFQLNICNLASAFVHLLSICYGQNGFKTSHIANTFTLQRNLPSVDFAATKRRLAPLLRSSALSGDFAQQRFCEINKFSLSLNFLNSQSRRFVGGHCKNDTSN